MAHVDRGWPLQRFTFAFKFAGIGVPHVAYRSTGGLALPAVPPATVCEPHTGAHCTGVRWDWRPEIPNAQDFSAFTRRRMSSTACGGLVRVFVGLSGE